MRGRRHAQPPPRAHRRGPTGGCGGDAALHARRCSATYTTMIIFCAPVARASGRDAGGYWWRSTASPGLWCLPRLDQRITNRIDATAGEDCDVRPRSAMTDAGSLDTDGSGRHFLPLVLSDPSQVPRSQLGRADSSDLIGVTGNAHVELLPAQHALSDVGRAARRGRRGRTGRHRDDRRQDSRLERCAASTRRLAFRALRT